MGGGESVWEAMNSWLTPSFLFVFLNLTIGTIAVISSFATQNNKPRHHQRHPLTDEDAPPPVLARAPSLLDRVKSFNFSFYAAELGNTNAHSNSYLHESPEFQLSDAVTPADPPPQQQQQLSRAPSLLERLKSFNLSFKKYELPQPKAEAEAEAEADSREPEEEKQEMEAPVSVSKKVAEKMRKSASSILSRKMEEEEDGDEVDRRRPATMRESGSRETASFGGEDEEVDAKADDFINRFKQQLKLQRLESLMRYREMLKRERGGSASGK